VKGDEKDWTKLYYTVFNAEQRQIVRDAVASSERVCVTTMDMAMGDDYERETMTVMMHVSDTNHSSKKSSSREGVFCDSPLYVSHQ